MSDKKPREFKNVRDIKLCVGPSEYSLEHFNNSINLIEHSAYKKAVDTLKMITVNSMHRVKDDGIFKNLYEHSRKVLEELGELDLDE